MTLAFNIVRFRVKPGREAAFLQAHRDADPNMKGFRRGSMVKTGERSFCLVGEWDSYADMAAARPRMISMLDSFRADLEELSPELGVTDPVSGERVLELVPDEARARRSDPL